MSRTLAFTTGALALAVGLTAASPASAVVRSWDAGGDGVNWEDPLNWTGDVLPGPLDLVFSGGGSRTVTLSSDQAIDALRFNDGDSLVHTGGRLTITAIGVDTESSLPEFGPAGSSYTMSGNAIYDQTDGGLFILGRAADGALDMSDDSQMINNGEIWLGMDSAFVGTMSGNASMSAANIHMARFASPSSQLDLSDNASINTGFFIMSDHPTLSGDSTLSLNGSGLSLNSTGLFMREGATMSFTADITGVSPFFVNGPVDLFDNDGGLDPQLSVDLSALPDVTSDVLLLDLSNGANGQFRGLGEGTVVPGSGGRTITYVGGDGNDIVLLGVPEPASLALFGLGGFAMMRRR